MRKKRIQDVLNFNHSFLEILHQDFTPHLTDFQVPVIPPFD